MAKSKYRKNLVTKPDYEVTAGNVKGRQYPTMTLMSSKLVPGNTTYLEAGWIWEMPDPNPHIFEHSHKKYNEIVLHIGSDPKNPEDLGAEIEFVVGDETLKIAKTSALFIPAGVKHGPVTWKSKLSPVLALLLW
jgi:hypothetical protein